MQCPVCKTKGINENAKRCPNCNSDLEAFQYIKKIEKSHRKNKNAVAILIILIIAGAIIWVYTYNNMKVAEKTKTAIETQKINRQQKQIEQLKSDKDQLMNKIVELRDKSNNFQKPISPKYQNNNVIDNKKTSANKSKTFFYKVKKGETLRSIAKEFYGSKNKYLKIMSDNNLKNANKLRVGQRLKIYK